MGDPSHCRAHRAYERKKVQNEITHNPLLNYTKVGDFPGRRLIDIYLAKQRNTMMLCRRNAGGLWPGIILSLSPRSSTSTSHPYSKLLDVSAFSATLNRAGESIFRLHSSLFDDARSPSSPIKPAAVHSFGSHSICTTISYRYVVRLKNT